MASPRTASLFPAVAASTDYRRPRTPRLASTEEPRRYKNVFATAKQTGYTRDGVCVPAKSYFDYGWVVKAAEKKRGDAVRRLSGIKKRPSMQGAASPPEMRYENASPPRACRDACSRATRCATRPDVPV